MKERDEEIVTLSDAAIAKMEEFRDCVRFGRDNADLNRAENQLLPAVEALVTLLRSESVLQRAEEMYICWMGLPWPRPNSYDADEFKDLSLGARTRWIRLAEAYERK